MSDHNPNTDADTQNDAGRYKHRPLGAVMKNPQNSEPPDEQSERHESNSKVEPKSSLPRRALTRFLERWRDPYRNRPNIAEWFTVALTVVIAGVGFLQWQVYKQQTKIMGSDNPQTQKLIRAADKSACAAKRSAQAAADFATAAKGIRDGVSDAVGKLQTQADETKALAGAALRQANAAHALAVEAANEGRPWIGITETIPALVADQPANATFLTTNSGRRPAKIVSIKVACREYVDFPADPDYSVPKDIKVRSTIILVPNAASTIVLPIAPVFSTKENLAVLDRNNYYHLFAYSQVLYKDVLDGSSHSTESCYVYIPKTRNNAAGFYNCTTYNNAD